MSQNDPTDQALAAIASLLDQPASPSSEKLVVQAHESFHQPDIREILQMPLQESISSDHVLEAPPSITHDPPDTESDGYFKFGPGPLASIRFKWTVRRETDDAYYVDETIGENSVPVVTGPMAANAAVRLVDDRESQARQRFEQIKNEITIRSMTSDLVETTSEKG